MHGEAEELVCGDVHSSGAECIRIYDHVNHWGTDHLGVFRVWQDYKGRRGPKKFPRVGDSLNDFPEWK